MSKEPQSMLEAMKCFIQILDAEYKKADLRTIVNDDCNKHLSTPEKASLLELLQEFEEMFDRTLRDWGCNPVSLKLRKEQHRIMIDLPHAPKEHGNHQKRDPKIMLIWGTQVASRF